MIYKLYVGGGGKNTSVSIGENVSVWRNFKLYVTGDSNFVLGDDCMLSYDITIWNGDGHSVLDKGTGEVLNTQKEPLYIGSHCWIGNNVSITKNARIPDNSIVAMCSVVSKKFDEEYTCIAGNPAKIVKNNVNWSRKNIYE